MATQLKIMENEKTTHEI